ncbi:uncharacterized protein [Venturia canescens]|uniref:uncharacterized protein n=1 Tax=Venturia canescens TaxID=32260 RepID=UPI001C9CDC86|nr:uncharacterized protein LOC122412182 [Venturia canescens]
MRSDEFNLSVLENAMEFASPLKTGSDYEAILDLIQHEFEMTAENETNAHKVTNSLHVKNDKYNDENLLKSPDNIKSLKMKNRISLLKHCRSHEKNKSQTRDQFLSRNGRSLGSAKPRRSFHPSSKKNCDSTSWFFETLESSKNVIAPLTGDEVLGHRVLQENLTINHFQGNQNILETPFADTNVIDQRSSSIKTKTNEKSFETAPEILESIDSNQVELDASKSHNPYSPQKSQDEDFVESSQNSTNSRLRQKLDELRSLSAKKSIVIGTELNENQESDFATIKNNDQSHSPSVLPEITSEISSEKKSAASSQPAKRKISPLEWYGIVSEKQQKLDSSEEQGTDLLKEQENNSSSEQENNLMERLENELSKLVFPEQTILPKDQNAVSPRKQKINASRQQKIDSHSKSLIKPLHTKQSELVSSSPLKGLSQELNCCITHCDYEQMSENLKAEMCDVTNFTFETIELLNNYEESNELTNNKILSRIFSSSSLEIKDEPVDHPDPSGFHEQTMEDPLHFEVKKTLNVGKNSMRKSPRVSNKFLMKQVAKIGNIAPSSSETKKNVNNSNKKATKKFSGIEKYLIRSRQSPRKSLSDQNEPSSSKQMPKSKKKSNGIKNEEKDNKSRRSNGKSKMQSPSLSKLLKLESNVDFTVEASKISKKIKEAEKTANLPEETSEILKNLVIKLRHDVLPQHNIGKKATSKHLTLEERKQFLQFAPLNKDNYTSLEDQKIKANWKAFCENHDWDPANYEPFLSFKHADELVMCLEERRKFAQYLADGLPNRPLYSVYNRFRRLFLKPCHDGFRYTSDEDTKILAYMLHSSSENSDKKCFNLSKVLGRKRQSIYSRYKKLEEKCFSPKNKDVLTKVEWDLCLVEEYVRTLLDVTLSEDLMELKDAFIPKVVWIKMEQKIKIQWQLLSRFWEQQLHLQLFSAQPIYLNEIKIKLIEHIYSSKIAHSMDIKWQHVLTYFDGLTTYFLRRTFNHLTAQTSKTLQTRNFKRIMVWLQTVKVKQLASLQRDKCLPRIKYNNKKAEFLVEDMETIKSYSGNVNDDDIVL